MDQASAPGGAGEREHFIPVRKVDVLNALIDTGGLDAPSDREKFRQLCRMLGAIYHYEYYDELERLREDYFYFDPETDGHSRADTATLERAYDDLIVALTSALHDANFIEITHEEIERAHREDALVRVKLHASLDKYREIRFFRRGSHKETVDVRKWFGFRKHEVDIHVYDDVVMLVTVKETEPSTKSQKADRNRKARLRPGAVLLKVFQNIASADLNALFPDVRVGMTLRDQLTLGVPALIGGIPILIKLASTLTVLFLVAGFYLGLSSSIRDEEWAGALAALGGLVALGGFFVQQWIRFQRQTLLHEKAISDNIYFRNVNNNVGVFDTIIGEAEDQECKEAFLAYYFLLASGGEKTAQEIDRRIEGWLKQAFGADLDFECSDALSKLENLGLLRRDDERLSVLPLDDALARLDRVWSDFFPAAPARAT
ncbi:MAG: DUF3754 domain-containing protein [Xanthobacteraceae bacterium]|nr:DUF3754 domain-containing protein [Xanthobacteraceae bacterium]